jgi:hypothetical protein
MNAGYLTKKSFSPAVAQLDADRYLPFVRRMRTASAKSRLGFNRTFATPGALAPPGLQTVCALRPLSSFRGSRREIPNATVGAARLATQSSRWPRRCSIAALIRSGDCPEWTIQASA